MYIANQDRYQTMPYPRCGKSGIKLPAVSLGLWHNFGGLQSLEKAREMAALAFDLGITHFDLANNYGPPYGSAEETFGQILKKDLLPYRDELIISTKAGWDMWPGPYGDFGSKKYLVASLDQSLKRMGLDYVDIFYHHRPDPETPIEETMDALAHIVRSGKALYVGISNYNAAQSKLAISTLKDMGVHCLIHQFSYSMLRRLPEEDGLIDLLEAEGVGSIAYSPLSQGLLTERYLKGIPEDSRAGGASVFLQRDNITPKLLAKLQALNEIASSRGQSLAQLALAWVLRGGRVTSVLIGASKLEQIRDCRKTVDNLSFTQDELNEIEKIITK
ncbi:MAG: aldo/keto reductase [Oscillospiraceae bacterium]|nr:aldo/keto reductase [Oscillospiraceae bacterium]